jgi:RNA polymerase sigma-70 factor (ECF subfamily)
LDAEDLTSRTFLSVVEGLPRYRHRGLFAAWLFTIARRKAIEHYRRRVPVTSIDELEVPSPASDPDVLAALAQDVDDLAGRIRDLNSSEQDLLRLRFAAQLSFKEVGAVVGKSEGATKKAIYRLLARLHDQMEDTHV